MKLIKSLFVVIVALVIGNVTLTNRSVDESVVVSTLSNEISTLQNQNTILRSQVASAGAIGPLSDKIAQAGFVATTKVASTATSVSVASR